MATEKKNIYQKLLTIQKAINGLGKDKPAFGYRYVTGDKVLEHIKPIMNQEGLILKQEVLSIENTRQDYNTKQGAKSEINSKVMMRFTWVDTDTGEKDENLFGANGQNDWDKGVGSALTYGERYFLLKYFHIATDEDDIDNPDRKPEEAQSKPVEPAPVQPTVSQAPQAETPSDVANTAIKYASAKQKEEIIRLLNNPVITRQEKTKMLLNIHKISEDIAKDVIKKIVKTIEERENETAASDGIDELAITEDQRNELRDLATKAKYERQVLQANLVKIQKARTTAEYIDLKNTYLQAQPVK